MMAEELSRFGALLEELQRNVSVIAECHGVLYQRFDEMTARFDRMDARFDQMDMKFNVMEMKFNARFDRLEGRVDRLETSVGRLEGFAIDAQRRLGQIETHLELNGSRSVSASLETSTGAPPGSPKKS